MFIEYWLIFSSAFLAATLLPFYSEILVVATLLQQPEAWILIWLNEHEYQRIAQYIIDNPKKWAMDKLNGATGNRVTEPMAQYNHEVWMI